jgi:gamma-aminobutyric acid type B receptor
LDLAAEQINNRTDLLPRHRVELFHEEAGCVDEREILAGLTRGLFPSDGRSAVGIIGPICSLDSILVSSITNRPELSLITLHSAGSPFVTPLQESSTLRFNGMELKFDYSLDILGSTQQLVDLSLALLKESGWHNISVLYENERPFYRSIARSFISSAVDELHVNINYVSTVDSNFYPLSEVWNNRARIVFVFTSVESSRRIICLAYHLKLVYPDYQFVLTNPTFDDFVGQDDIIVIFDHKEYRCSAELLVNESLDRAFLISHQLDTLSTINEVTFANTTFKRFLELYEQRIEEYNSEHEPDVDVSISPAYPVLANGLYDALWAWAIVLDQLTSDNEGLVFEYGNQTLANLILDKFYSLDFQGISGNIRFDSNGGYVTRQANLYQILDDEVKLVAYSNGTHTVVQLADIHTIPDVVGFLTLPHRGIVGFFFTIQSIGLVVVVILHFATLIRRNTKIVKASSPKLVQPAYFGTYAFILTMMLYVSFFSSKVHSPTVGMFICQTVWAWLMPLSFTLTMGIVTLRTWRVYRIFFHFINPGKFISNPALFCILLIMVSIDLLIGTIWTALDTMQFYIVEYTTEGTPANEILLDQTCFSRYNAVWLGVVFLYRIILLLIMVTLALLTRNIPNQTFATTSLRVFSYIFSMVMILGFSLYFFFLYTSPHSSAGPILLCATMNIMLVLYIACILAPPVMPEILKRNNSIK